MYEGYLTDVEGIKVGHEVNLDGMTGTTVIICEEGATGGVDVRGSAPGTRETDLFKAEKMVDQVHSVVLSGGSAFGLEAASGVMQYLEDNNIGLDVGVTRVPIVASAVIFDLNIGDFRIRPNFNMGYMAAKSANTRERKQGNVGCGLGATVGKILGPNSAMKSGLGSASIKVGDLVVSALVSTNAFGDVYNYEDNEQMAGVYDYERKEMLNTIDIMRFQGGNMDFGPTNTTIGIVCTNGILTKAEANKIAQMAHNGFAKSINPIHTMLDGDTIFTMATNKIKSDVNLIGTMAAEVMSRAISNSIVYAESYENIKSYKDIIKK